MKITKNPTKELLNQRILFGLRAQGHVPTIEKMLAEGASWEEIGKAISWDPATAKDFYEREVLEKRP